tara:strand:- start:28844 stop:28963 length:120 start_codon:yes stop_codon:yes gene_type:complete
LKINLISQQADKKALISAFFIAYFGPNFTRQSYKVKAIA